MNTLRNWFFLFFVFSGVLTLSGCTALGLGSIPLDELNARYANEASRYVNVGDNLVHYRDEGTGPVILALHGIVDSLHTWGDSGITRYCRLTPYLGWLGRRATR